MSKDDQITISGLDVAKLRNLVITSLREEKDKLKEDNGRLKEMDQGLKEENQRLRENLLGAIQKNHEAGLKGPPRK